MLRSIFLSCILLYRCICLNIFSEYIGKTVIMTCKIVCLNGNVICSLQSLLNHSLMLRDLFKDACQCTATLILPDINMDVVTLGLMKLEDTSNSDVQQEVSEYVKSLFTTCWSFLVS